ncbi:hypothetical protein [Aeromonas veronii]|uniref:hypothetical protein n=1 Tax=Aeromonas veronii TaxID=654 RepID=UPI003D2013B2
MSSKLISTDSLSIELDTFQDYIDHFICKSSGKKYYVVPEIRSVIDYIYTHPELWAQAEISVVDTRQGIKRAPIIGPSFEEAFNIALQGDRSFSWFCGDRKAQHGVHIADTCMIVEKNKGEIWFESWSFMRDIDGECFYTHVIYNEDNQNFRHCDASKFYINQKQKDTLKKCKTKPRGLYYQKMFSLNGKIPRHHVIGVIKAFLPFDNLTDEMLGQAT